MSDTTARIYEKKYKVKLLINITEEQDVQLRQMAKETGKPVSELIRDGIDGVLSGYNAHGIVSGAEHVHQFGGLCESGGHACKCSLEPE